MANTDTTSSNNKVIVGRRISGQRHLSDPIPGYEEQELLQQQRQQHGSGGHHNEPTCQDPDLFSILNSMHLSNQLTAASAQIMAMPHPVVVQSRKRKILDERGHGFNGSGSGKLNGTRNPAHRRNSDDDEEAGLHTPQCSQSGYADEDDRHAERDNDNPTGQHGQSGGQQTSQSHQKNKRGFMSPEINDIVDDNLAADFDGSLSGLGVDIHTASFSMSEALNALPNLSISSSHIFKQELPSPAQAEGLKAEPNSNGSDNKGKNYGALDLSNDEAYLPDSNNQSGAEDSGPMTFTGSVSRESTPANTLTFTHAINRYSTKTTTEKTYVVNLSASNPNLSIVGSKSDSLQASPKPQKVIIPLQNNPSSKTPPSSQVMSQDNMKVEKRSYETLAISEIDVQPVVTSKSSEDFQYILAASTSIATKINEPTITYLNQSQAYELRMKKLGDLSHYRKRLLRCVLRVCFHERRLQYMEADQIAEWSSKHPGERIIDADMPLSYGITELYKDSSNINCLSFKWDPTRDTGIFIKINCISTEFTPKKHGGEKGVPFRLQVETYDGDSRIHAAGCILQVFKLKGADRKHKQDRDKINKRPLAEQEKFAPSYDCTMLTILPIEHIYVPVNLSRPVSPVAGQYANASGNNSVAASTSSANAAVSVINIENKVSMGQVLEKNISLDEGQEISGAAAAFSHLEGVGLELSATPCQVSSWLVANRFSEHVNTFRNYDGRDILRLPREDIILLCGNVDGVRIYNCVHRVPVPPKTVIYVGGKDGDNEYSALYLEELTVTELLKKLTEAFAVDLGLFTRAFLIGPKGIYIHFTDHLVRHMRNETVLQFSLRATSQSEGRGGFDVVFEEINAVDSRMSNSSPGSNSNS